MKLNKLAVAVTSAVLLMAGNIALADSTSDIVNVLVDKGILSPEEGKLISKNSVEEKKKAQASSGKIKISDAIDNATVYGDVRVRYESRAGTGVATVANTEADETRERGRYKLVFGVKTTGGDFYSDIAFAMGAAGRSDNATFAGASSSGQSIAAANGNATKERLNVKRAMLGWNVTPWLAVEAGRIDNPLYTTSMVWDADLQFEGLAEKLKYSFGDLDVFANLAQSQYLGDRRVFDGGTGTTTITNELLATQLGAKYAFSPKASGKAAITYYGYTHGGAGLGNWTPAGGGALATASASTANTNFLDIWEIPAEVNFMATDSIGIRAYGDYAWNTSADDRARAGGVAAGSSGSDDKAWLFGVAIASAKDLKSFEANKMLKGDWSARLWYQETGIWALDQNAVDSDIFDSRINMKGTAFKAQYNIQDNVMANLTYAYGERKNNAYATMYSAGADLSGLNVRTMDLWQLDLTYKF